MPIDTHAILQQIDEALSEWKDLRSRSKHDDCSDQPDNEITAVEVRLASTIDRFSPETSYHKSSLQKILESQTYPGYILARLVGAISALRREYELGHLQSFQELVHADTFASFIEMADYLQQQGYKDPAAVIAGSILEQHLRELSIKSKLVVQVSGKYKTADSLNAELSGKGIYSKLDQKNVTSWLGLRNAAAHGNYSNYTATVPVGWTASGENKLRLVAG